MNLAIGTRLGPYEIRAAIGAGGMGEAFDRGQDTPVLSLSPEVPFSV